MDNKFDKFTDFFIYYLSEHNNDISRGLHFVGTTLALVLAGVSVVLSSWTVFALGVVSGYLFAWFGHFFFEKNKPATFKYPVWSLLSDFIMLGLFLTGRLGPYMKKARERFVD